MYHRDRRVLSSLDLAVDGAAPPLLTARRDGSRVSHRVHTLAADPFGSPTALLRVRREVRDGAVREEYTVDVFAGALRGTELAVSVAADFADLQTQKHAVPDRPAVPFAAGDGGWVAQDTDAGVALHVEGPRPRFAGQTLAWTLDATPGRPWHSTLVITPRDGARPPGSGARPDLGLRVSTPLRHWEQSTSSAVADLEALRIDAPALQLSYLGAGAPWFMALFGRDTLLTGWESLITGTDLALDVLESLARYQGRTVDERTGEQPGRILHELRTGGTGVFGLPPGRPYYRTVDASPLFVMLLGEAHRWGADPGRVTALLPTARAALAWCTEHGDLDGDGFVEYAGDPRGLANQGWKDSGDAMVHADGRLAPPPIALAEVQAYVVAAHRALAALEERLGDPPRAPALRAAADRLQAVFQDAFWVPEHDLLAMALDGDKRPLAVSSSNPGHCLWAEALDPDLASRVAAGLARRDLRAAWGLRTLASSEVAYNPLGYHLGSIWPHDAAIGAAGLMRYGHVETALQVTGGLLAAAEHFAWRLPELFGGLDTDEVPYPVPYPVACSPQAWSAAAPLLLLRTVLRLDPDVPGGRVFVAPVLAEDADVVVQGVPLGADTLSMRVRRDEVEVLSRPDDVEVVTAVRPGPGPTHPVPTGPRLP